MRVVVSAYACEPGGTSERGVAWEWVCAAAEAYDVTLVTRTQFREAIRDAVAARPDLNLSPVFIDPPRRWTPWKRGERGLYPFYLLWQVFAWRTISVLHREHPFDIGHHLTFALDWLPAGVAFVRDLPVVWGPVGPGSAIPPVSLWRHLGLKWAVRQSVRAVVSSSMRMVFGRATESRSAVLVAQNLETAAQHARHPQVVVEQNAVIDAPPAHGAREESGDDGLRRAICVGRLIDFKGVSLAIEAVARAGGWSLQVFGDGPARASLEERARRCGIQDRVTFRGFVPREQILYEMTNADVLLFPSTREAAGVAVAEAITLGLPVICLDLGGPATMVRDDEGARIAAGRNVVQDIAAALANVSPRHDGHARWGAARIPPLLESWYVAAKGERGHG